MKQILEKKLLHSVIKPGRYVGGEIGQIVKDPQNRLNYLHAFPDKYELGQSYVGLQIIYNIINSDDRFLCERTFAVDNDAEEIMRRENIPLFSLESHRPAAEFDAIGFTLPYELVATTVLNMLDLAGLPLKANERNDEHPIIMAGGPAVYNPEPMADYIDLFFIGDAESGFIEMLEIMHQMKGATKNEKLKEIVKQVKSVYAPLFYDDKHQPLFDFAPSPIAARVEKVLKPEYYPKQPLVSLIETTHKHLSVEIMRGCPQGCRFCQAGPIYRPVRVRPIDEIVNQVENQHLNSGYEEVTLLSLSSTDYPEVDNLAMTVARKLERQRVSVTLPSLRPGSISPKLLDAMKKVRKAGLTISPEAGTLRLRKFIRKDFPDEAIFDTVKLAFEKGWTTLKFYFMVGLPTETDEDLIGIVDILKECYDLGRKYRGRKTFNVTLSPFVPKAHTPFQWDEILHPKEVLRRIHFIKRTNKISHINFKYSTIETSLLQGLIGRGGRQIGDVILDVFQNGGRFDGWGENFDYSRWEAAFEKYGISIDDLLKPISFEAKLHWGHIQKGVSTEFLKKERHRTSTELKDFVPFKRDEKENDETGDFVSYGRSNKKVASRMTTAPTKNKIRLRWGKSERYRYMGHLDNLRLIEKSIRMSDLPIAYSQGFNPSMKLSFGPPLPLGFISSGELLDITLDTNFMPYMADKLIRSLPEGFELFDSRVILSKTKSLAALLNRAVYRLPLDPTDDLHAWQEKIDELLKSNSLIIKRVGKDKVTELEVRPAIYELTLKDNALEMVLGMGDGGYIKPSELLFLLQGEDFDRSLLNRFCRTELFRIDENNLKIEAMEL